ncbi:hypothetical protein ACFL4V_01890 [Candidatus Latescibacterota bacterium]
MNYKEIFNNIDSTLIEIGLKNIPEEEIRSKLNEFKKVEKKKFTDLEYFWIFVCVIFYSGFKASTVTSRLDLINSNL